MAELSVIIPQVNEWPNSSYTIRSIYEELRERCDFEIIVIDNFCDQVARQCIGFDKSYDRLYSKASRLSTLIPADSDAKPLMDDFISDLGGVVHNKRKESMVCDRSRDHLESVAKGYPWLKVIRYQDKLSHWNAKNIGVQASSGKYLWFCDAHCAVSRNGLFDMFQYYKDNYDKLNGAINLPLTYHIMEYHRLIYKAIVSVKNSDYHYSFSGCWDDTEPYEVPVMSCCGVMISREIYDKLGGWPEYMGIYGGGENFFGYTLATLGMKRWIFPNGTLFHHGEKRGYSQSYDDTVKNRCIATYLFGGEARARRHIDNVKGRKPVLDQIYNDVITQCKEQREWIKKQQVIDIDSWCDRWSGHRFYRDADN